MKIAVIADDLTGALDTGVQFRKWGFTVQLMDATIKSKVQVIIINTNTRNQTPEIAYQTTYEAAKKVANHDIIYKKTDSTLRGNPGPELQAILDATSEKKVIFTPTYPQTNRIVQNGHLYVGGRLITETDYVQEYKIHTSYIPEILATETPIYQIKDTDKIPKLGIMVIDSKTEKDLLNIANKQPRILAGSAGLANALCQVLRSPPPVITIIGSMRTETRKQATNLSRRLGSVLIPLDTIKSINRIPQYETIQRAKEVLKKGNDVIITSASSQKVVDNTKKEAKRLKISSSQIETRITETLAEITEALLNNNISGIIATGGATTLAITKKLAIKNLDIIDEVQPGIPVIKLDCLTAITKAGGFGTPDTLIQASHYLKRRYR